MTSSLANSVDQSELGVWGAAQQMLNQIASVTGIQVLRTVQQVTEPSAGKAAAYGHAFQVGMLSAIIGVALAAFVRNSRAGATR